MQGMLESHVDGAILLMQVVLKISGNIPSAFTSLVERYEELLRTLPAEGDEVAIVKSLSDSTSHDGGLFLSFLDICLRRAVVSGAAAMAYLCSDHVLATINDNIWVSRLAICVVERSLDIVRAALVQYIDSGGAFPFDLASVASLIQQEEEAEGGDETMQDESNYAVKALGAAVLGAQRIHSGLVTSLVRHAAGPAMRTWAWRRLWWLALAGSTPRLLLPASSLHPASWASRSPAMRRSPRLSERSSMEFQPPKPTGDSDTATTCKVA